MVAHQRKIREAKALTDWRPPIKTLDGWRVERITYEEAERVILEYEWLGTMPTVCLATYGLIAPWDELAGVACFGPGPGRSSNDLCGPDLRQHAVALERGACVHWAHEHAGSFLVSRACALAHRDHGWRIVYAYADVTAGEIGTIYQACNWVYVGQSTGRGAAGRWTFISKITGRKWSTKSLRALCKKQKIDSEEYIKSLRVNPSWEAVLIPDKHRYVHFMGDRRQRKEARAALKYPQLPYPKRD